MSSIEPVMSDTFLVEATGDVYVNGIKKNTRLPEIHVGSKVSLYNVSVRIRQINFTYL